LQKPTGEGVLLAGLAPSSLWRRWRPAEEEEEEERLPLVAAVRNTARDSRKIEKEKSLVIIEVINMLGLTNDEYIVIH